MTELSTVEKARDLRADVVERVKSPAAMLIPQDVRLLIIAMAALLEELAEEVERLKPYVDEA